MCNAITKKGTRCKNDGKYDGYCYLHSQENVQARNYRQYLLRSKQTELLREMNKYNNSKLRYETPIDFEEKVPLEYHGFDGVNIDVNDGQNVHKKDVNDNIKKGFEFLKTKYSLGQNPLETCELEIVKLFDFVQLEVNKIRKNPQPYHFKTEIQTSFIYKIYKFFTNKTVTKVVEDQNDYCIDLLKKTRYISRWLISFSHIKSLLYSFLYILLWINDQKENRLLLFIRFHDELKDGESMCLHGRICRMLNVMSGISTHIDVRSQNEIIQDKMAQLSKEPIELRLKLAEEFFSTIKIRLDEKQVWIDALIDE